MSRQFKIIVEKHPDGYVAYESALADVKSAIEFHLETFGSEALGDGPRPRRHSAA